MAEPNWDQVSSVFNQAIALPPEEREAFLRRQTRDEATYHSVVRLIKAAESSTGYLMTTPLAANQNPSLESGARIGAWRAERLLGAGGMGEVYLASRADGHFEQTAALKLIRSGTHSLHARFDRERAILARLEHPNIARLIDGGEAPDGRLYMVVEHVEGRPVDLYAREENLDRAARLRLALQVCEALSHAHARLVLHRDIKPGNVLVTESGAVRLIDFGVAALLADDADSDLASPLTLAYSAPEQFHGEPVSAATDVFAVGALICALLSGEPPERKGDRTLATLPPDLARDRELASILRRAMADRPADRYASADALAADLTRYLKRQPVAAMNGGTGYHVAKFLSRHRAGSALAALLVASLAIGLTASLVLASRARTEAQRANAEAVRAEAEAVNVERQAQVAAAYSNALQTVFGGDEESGDAVDPEVVRQSLLRHARDALALKDENPHDAGYTLFAIGQSFVFRNDYPAAIEVLEPYVEHAVGDPVSVGHGQGMLSRAYLSVGRREEAAELARVNLAALREQSPYSAEHAASASYLAVATGEEADREHALSVLARAIEKDARDNGGQLHPFLYNETGFHNYQMGRLDAAIEGFQKSVDAARRNNQLSATENDTSLLNLGRLYLFHRQDTASAQALFDEVVEINTAIKGASLRLGEARMELAEIQLLKNDPAAALTLAENAIDAIRTYSGERSDSLVQALVVKGRAQSRLGDLDAARETRARLAALGETWPDQAAAQNSLRFLDAFMAARAGDAGQTRALTDSLLAAREAGELTGLRAAFYLDQLESQTGPL